MVGWAMHGAATIDDIPAHRVVNSQGLLTGKAHFGGTRMEDLLKGEQIEVVNDKVQDLPKCLLGSNERIGILIMRRSGHADLPLHHGRVPQWLAQRMSKLGGAIIESIVAEYG